MRAKRSNLIIWDWFVVLLLAMTEKTIREKGDEGLVPDKVIGDKVQPIPIWITNKGIVGVF